MQFRPYPLYSEQTRLDQLHAPEAFIVVALRLWAASLRGGPGCRGDWREGFRIARLEQHGIPAFETFTRILRIAATRALDVRLLGCGGLGQDEAWFLQHLGALQFDQRIEARAILEDWMPPGAARMALEPAQGLADALTQAGLILPLREREAQCFRQPPPGAAQHPFFDRVLH
jgi:hypothetical protein